jgi:two-component system cell cycle response regulator DivK
VANELILIVEDNDKNRKLVRDVLHFKGYRLAEAETGEERVRLAHELHPDLILMDIQLPGIDGATALRQLRGDPATRMIPALAVTPICYNCSRVRGRVDQCAQKPGFRP